MTVGHTVAGRISGKIAIVTGGASGIGSAIVDRFQSEGAAVLAVDLSPEALEAAHGKSAAVARLAQDITAPDAPDVIVGRAIALFGGLDILVNNAGVCDCHEVETTSDAIWQRTIDVDLTAIFRLSRSAVPELRKRGAGRIINTASIMAERPYPSLAAYTAAKHGVAGLTKVLAVELGKDGITANYVLPGATLTNMTLPLIDADPGLRSVYDSMGVLGRMANPEELASAFLYLASDEAAFITGHGLVVDGGALLKM